MIEIQVVKVKVPVENCDCRSCKPRYIERPALKNGKHLLILDDISIFEGLRLRTGMILQVRAK